MRLCELRNTARPGFMPFEELVVVDEQYCSNVTTGITRQYAAMGANKDYSLVVILWNICGIPHDVKYAVDEDDVQYRIDIARPIYDDDTTELTLVRLEDFYDVTAET